MDTWLQAMAFQMGHLKTETSTNNHQVNLQTATTNPSRQLFLMLNETAGLFKWKDNTLEREKT